MQMSYDTKQELHVQKMHLTWSSIGSNASNYCFDYRNI